MKYVFLNKNHRLFEFNYNESEKRIVKIERVYDKEKLPYIFNDKEEQEYLDIFEDWLNDRYSRNSSWYKNIERRFKYLTIGKSLIVKSYGLSLSDQYWLKPTNDKSKWEDVNFFNNEFKYQPFVDNMDRIYDYHDVDVLYTPHITTGGELNKAWAINEKKERVLYKSSNTFLGTEPINECIVSKMGHILELPVCDYEIKILSNLEKKTMVSSCKTFVNSDTELVPASQILNFHGTAEEEYNEYIKILEEHGIPKAKEKIDKMLFIDVIICNPDRHLNNFGIIREVETGRWLDVAPLFDSGRSFHTAYNSMKDVQKFCIFRHFGSSKEDVYEIIKDLSLTNRQVEQLKKIPTEYDELITKYKKYTTLDEYRDNRQKQVIKDFIQNIDEAVSKINIIEKLQKEQEESKEEIEEDIEI